MKQRSFFVTLAATFFMSIFCLLVTAYAEAGASASISVSGVKGIRTVCIEGEFGTIYGYYMGGDFSVYATREGESIGRRTPPIWSKHYAGRIENFSETFLFDNFKYGDDVPIILTIKVQCYWYDQAEAKVTHIPQGNEPICTMLSATPTTIRGLTSFTASYECVPTFQAYTYFTLSATNDDHYYYGEDAGYYVYHKISLSSDGETEGLVVFDIDPGNSEFRYEGPYTIELGSRDGAFSTFSVYVDNEVISHISDIPQVIKSPQTISVDYSFPTTLMSTGSLYAHLMKDGAYVKTYIAQENFSLSSLEEVSGSWSFDINPQALEIAAGSYELQIWSRFGDVLKAHNIPFVFANSEAILKPKDKPFNLPDVESGTYTDDPINIASGNMYTVATDISVQSGALPLILKRKYNSQDDYEGVFGYGWRSLYDILLTEQSDGSVYEVNYNDEYTFYTPNDDGGYDTSEGKYSSLTKHTDGTFVIVRKNGIQHHFSAEGSLTEIVDRNGNSISLAYDENNVPTTIVHSCGYVLMFTADENGHITAVEDPAGRSTQYAYDENGNLTSATDPLGNSAYYSYDDDHNMVVKHTLLGTPVYFAYDSEDRAYRNWQDGDVNSVTLDFVDDGKTIMTDSLGGQTIYEFNEYGLVHTTTDPAGNVTYTGWDDAFNKTYTTDAEGATNEFSYDDTGNLIALTDPAGNSTTFEYESIFNQVTRVVDALGNETIYSYDAQGNVTQVTDALGNVVQHSYDALGNLLSTIDPLGHVTTFTYDAKNNLVAVTDALGNETHFAYDAVGNVLSVTDALGNETHFAYDLRDRQIAVTYADGAQVSFTYDEEDNRTSVTDPKGEKTQFEYDALSRLTKVVDALSYATEYRYDTEGNECAMDDAKENTTAYTYDMLNRIITEATPLGNVESYAYNGRGDTVSVTDAKGDTIYYTYDVRGLLTDVSYPDGTAVSFTYDALGRKTSMTDQHGTTTYVYDALGRVLSVDGPRDNDTVSYEYDAGGNRIKMIDQEGEETTYTYDARNRLTSVCRGEGPSPEAQYTYDVVSNLIRVDYANGTYAEYTYDNCNRVVSLANKNDNDTLKTFTYAYDINGMRTEMRENDDAVTRYTYDDLNRLITEKRYKLKGKGKEVLAYSYEYSYDVLGNRTKMVRQYTDDIFVNVYGDDFADYFNDSENLPLIESTYEYNEENQLLHLAESLNAQGSVFDIAEKDFTYDNNGNLVQTIDNRQETIDYAYDFENRLRSIVNGLSSSVYTYDGVGKRLQVNDNGTVTNYFYDGGTPIIERDANGGVIAQYTRGIGYGGGIGSIINKIVPQGKKKLTKTYYHYDALGNVTDHTDEDGKHGAWYQYDSFGNVLRQGGKKNDQHQFQFSTKEKDSTGLVYFGARYYNPQLGRWITKDPAGLVDGPNVYAYVRNNPVNFVDSWGNESTSAVPGGTIDGGSGSGLIGPSIGEIDVSISSEVRKEIEKIVNSSKQQRNKNGTSKGNVSEKVSAKTGEKANSPTVTLKRGKKGTKGKKGENNQPASESTANDIGRQIEKDIDKAARRKFHDLKGKRPDRTMAELKEDAQTVYADAGKQPLRWLQ